MNVPYVASNRQLRTFFAVRCGSPVSWRLGGLWSPSVTKDEICSTDAHVQPSGNEGRFVSVAPLVFVFPFAVPFFAALFKNALQELFAGFVAAIFFAGEFGFGGNEATFAGGFEHAGAVAFQRGLHPLQRRHSCIQSRELLLNLRHDALLFVERSER